MSETQDFRREWGKDGETHAKYKTIYLLLGGALLVLLGVWIGSSLFATDGPLYRDDGYATNLYTELLGVILTVVIVDVLYRNFDLFSLSDKLFLKLN